jgi:hypothetical protein
MQEGVMEEVIIRGSQASWFKQLCTLTKRSFTNMSRDFGYYRLRIIIYMVMAVCLGTIYYDVGTSYTAIQARASCGGFVSGFMTFMSIGGFPSFIEEMKVFTLEGQNGHYGVAAYAISNFLSSCRSCLPCPGPVPPSHTGWSSSARGSATSPSSPSTSTAVSLSLRAS